MKHMSQYLVYKGSKGEKALLNEEDQKKVDMGNYLNTPDLDLNAVTYRNDHNEIDYRKWTQSEEIDAVIQFRAVRMKWGCREHDV